MGVCLFILVACGNKGALVMPQKPVNVPVSPPLPVEATSQGDHGASQPAVSRPARHPMTQDGGD